MRSAFFLFLWGFVFFTVLAFSNSSKANAANSDHFQLRSTNFCLNSPYRANNGNVDVWTCDGNDPDQDWVQEGDLIRLKNTNYCLNTPYRSENGNIFLWTCNSSDPDQKWERVGDLIRLKGTNLCVNTPYRYNAGNVFLWTCNSGDADQKWVRGTNPAPTLIDGAKYDGYETIVDGTDMSPSQTFTKTWRLKNTGTTTWTTSYKLSFESGTQLGTTTNVYLSRSVSPGQTIDISVPMKAPASGTNIRSNWKMKNASGSFFGDQVWVIIDVKGICPGYGDYCGERVNQDQNSLFFCSGVGANPTLKQACSNGCQQNTDPNPDVCKASLVDGAQFGGYETINDGAYIAPGQTFTKTWRVKNTGTTTWSTSYKLAFESGTQFGGVTSVNLPISVSPGNVIDISVPMTAPTSGSNLRSNWKMKNPSGNFFGDPLWVIINVGGPCPSGGLYCGGRVGQDQNYLYRCAGTGAFPTLEQACSNGCSGQPDPNPDVCTAVLSDNAEYGDYETVLDYTDMSPNQNFTKTWRLKNTGTSTWTTSYKLSFESGRQLGSNVSINLPRSVSPGQSIDLSVNMTAPSTTGTYRSNWKMKSPSGNFFGEPVWVIIDVVGTQTIACPRPGDYCGDTSLGQNPNYLYNCAQAGSIPTQKQTCSSGCQINPPGYDDVCKTSTTTTSNKCQNISSSDWAGAGDYCVGDYLVSCDSNRKMIGQNNCGVDKCKKNSAGYADVCIIGYTQPSDGGGTNTPGTPGSIGINEVINTDDADISHLYWPFTDSSWSEKSGWRHNTGSAFHWDSDYKAQDWGAGAGKTCDKDFLSPINGKVLFSGCLDGVTSTADCNNKDYGRQVIIQSDTNNNYAFRIAHLNSLNTNLKQGDQVYGGITKLGTVGNTGEDYGNPMSCHAHGVLYKNINDKYPNESSTITGVDRLKLGRGLGLLKGVTTSKHDAKFEFDLVGTNPGTDFMFPVNWTDYKIEKDFGYGQGPVNAWKDCNGGSTTNNGNKYHAGLDIIHKEAVGTNEANSTNVEKCKRGALGTPVYAVGSGVITEIEDNLGSDGDRVTMRHDVKENGKDVYSSYMHIDRKSDLNEGERIGKGDPIGVVGNYSNNPHLHFEMRTFANWSGGYTSTNNPGSFGYINPCEFISRHNGRVPSSCPNMGARGGAIETLYSSVTAEFPISGLSQDVLVSLYSLDESQNLPVSSIEHMVGQAFGINIQDTDGYFYSSIEQSFLLKKLYNENEIENIDESSLKIKYLDTTSNQWQTLSTTINSSDKTVVVSTNKTGIYAVFGKQATPTSSAGTELLPSPWHIVGNNGSAELYHHDMDPDGLKGMDTLRITYDLHGINAIGGDASAIIFDQNGWKFISLADYGENGKDGLQTVDIPLSDFNGLDPDSDVGTLHTRFWYGSSFTVDVTSIVAYNSQQGTPTITPTPVPTSTPTPTPVITPTPTPVPTNTPTPTPVTTPPPSSMTELLPSPWHIKGNNGSAELYHHSMSSSGLNGKDMLRITYNLHGINAIGGDASAIIFDQNGWKFISLADYGENGKNGWQTVDIPLSDFEGLNPNASVGTLHTRFWYGSAFTVDITSIKAYNSQNETPTTTPTPIPTVVAPVVSLSGSPTTITAGQSSTLTWSTTGTSPTCSKSGGWTGSVAVSGTQSVNPTSNTTYTISCTNSAGTNSKSVTITVNTPTPVPTMAAKPIPGKIEAESYSAMSGIQTESTSDTGGGTNVGWMDTGDWLDYNVNVASSGNYTVQYRVASGTGGSINGVQLRKTDGTVLTTLSVPNTGGWQTWTTISATVNLSAGTQTLRVHVNNSGWNLNWLNFSVAPTATPTPVPTITPTPTPSAEGIELLSAPWHLTGNNGSAEKYQSISSSALQGKTKLRITYDLHGINALGGDASAIIFDQNGWQFVSLANYGQNGKNGPQTVDIPLSHFSGLNPNASVGTLHTRFWYGSAFTVDITSIRAI